MTLDRLIEKYRDFMSRAQTYHDRISDDPEINGEKANICSNFIYVCEDYGKKLFHTLPILAERIPPACTEQLMETIDFINDHALYVVSSSLVEALLVYDKDITPDMLKKLDTCVKDSKIGNEDHKHYLEIPIGSWVRGWNLNQDSGTIFWSYTRWDWDQENPVKPPWKEVFEYAAGK